MEDMKLTLKEVVARRLAAAPDSTAKSELIEELTENLFSRYTDLTAGGASEEEARDRAVDALGDTDELVEYLKTLEPHQSLPELVLDPDKTDGGQIEEILHNVEGILRGAFHKAKNAFRDAKDVVKQSINNESESDSPAHDGELGELEQKMHELETTMEANQLKLEALQEALSQLENARDALENVSDQSVVEQALADIEVKIGAKEAEIEALEEAYAAMEEEFDALEEEFDELEEALDELDELDDDLEDGEDDSVEITIEQDKASDKGWKVSYQDKSGRNVEFDSESFKGSMKDMMKDIEQVIREATGMAKDITKSACKAAKEGGKAAANAAREGSKAAWEAAAAACTPDTAVEADQPIDAAQLKAIDVQTFGGDITVRMSQEPDGNVIVGGDTDDIEVFRSADGVLTVRPIKTETASFFFGRGIFSSSSSADVVLDLPRREWESIRLTTTNGDVELSGEFPVDRVFIGTVSGEINAALPSCAKAACKTTNGDIRWNGDVSDLRMDSISGDAEFRGSTDSVTANSTSGDLTLEGSHCAAVVRTVSGDICLRSSVMPDRVDVATTSGDTWMDIPDAGPFTAKFRSTSGDFTSDFFTGRMGGRSCTFTYQGGGEHQYNFASISGDVEIRKYR